MPPAAPLVCHTCSHEQEFVRQPLYCLAGPSGTGKSTVGHALLPRLADRFVVLEQDVRLGAPWPAQDPRRNARLSLAHLRTLMGEDAR